MSNSDILKHVNDILGRSFPDQIVRVLLFGSRARGSEVKESDYDLLIITKVPFGWKREREIIDLCADISIDHDILLDVKIISAEELETIQGRMPWIQAALSEGIA
jgi:uncharacterized protein